LSEIDELVKLDTITIQQILNNLLSDDKNLELKTQIDKPLNLSVFYMFADSLKSFGFDDISNLLKSWISIFLKYMVSDDRQSRKEVIRAISSLNQNDKEGLSFAKKLITDMSK
jgi:hypothetical protein